MIEIKMIRSIRICKTPALGGRVYECRSCKHRKYVYYGCGNSRCPKCQGIKRMQWQEKLAQRLYRCPYVHMVFTMPHALNSLARSNPSELYQCLMRSAWSSLLACAEDPAHLGARPGAVMVLHTFGSDLKYHVHVHALVTFGGIDPLGKWRWPVRKNKLVAFRKMRRTFRSHFLSRLKKIHAQLHTYQTYESLHTELTKKSWCVHAEPPTLDSDRIKEYLGKYICRIGLSKQRFNYNSVHQKVTLQFKDYRSKTADGHTPVASKSMQPLVAIHQILQHCLPRYFQKCRYLGLHANACQKKYCTLIPKKIQNNTTTIRSVFQLIHAMIGLDPGHCTHCHHDQIDVSPIVAQHDWIHTWLDIHQQPRGSPKSISYRAKIVLPQHRGQVASCSNQTIC